MGIDGRSWGGPSGFRLVLAGAAIVLGALTSVAPPAGASATPSPCGSYPWCSPSASPAQRASELEAAMTMTENVNLVAEGAGVPGLGLPPLLGVDGPNGIGEGNTGVTAFPSAQTMASAWDPALAEAYGRALGGEAAGKGYDWLYAPTVNIVRTPLWGREAETLGEDPFLAGVLGAAEVRGIQSQHVIAEVKHYVAYDQEVDRFGQPLGGPAISDTVSERALREIYLPPFQAAVAAGHAGSVMCSYNRLNTVYACQDPALLGALDSFGLQGFIGPDADLAVRNDVAALNAGVDEMRLGSLATTLGQSEPAIIEGALADGQLSVAPLADAVHRILTAMFEVGLPDHPPPPHSGADVSTPADLTLATEIAEAGTVLLKNRGGLLPLSPGVGSLAVIGADAGSGTQIEENGSPAVVHGPVITPLAGIRQVVGSRSRVIAAPGTLGVVALPDIPASVLTPSPLPGHGWRAAFYTGQVPSGTPVATRVDPTVDFSSIPLPLSPIPGTPGAMSGVWTGTLIPPATGTYRFSIRVSGVAALWVAGRQVAAGNAEFFQGAGVPGSAGPTITFQGEAHLVKGRRVPVKVQYATGSSIGGASLQVGWEPPRPSMLAAAVRAARQAKVAVVFVNDVTSEGMDRTSLVLPGDQDRLISAVARANPRTVVVLHTAGPVLMPWLPKVASVLWAGYPGQQSGAAIAATLFGRSDPSGHLVVTFPRSANQGPATRPSAYPGLDNSAQYSEGIFVGYRYYDEHHQTPLFPFGFGLSYTTFALQDLQVTRTGSASARASVPVRNIGRRSGAEVVQAYLQFPASAGEPPRQLKAFARVWLRPGERRTVQLALPRSSFEDFDPTAGRWVVPPGTFTLLVGTSSRDLPLQASIPGVR